MGQTISSVAPWRKGAHAAGLVAKHLDPWSRGRCACINQAWNRAVQKVYFCSSPDADNQHWLVAAEKGNSTLWMCNVVTGHQKVVKPDLPWGSIPTDPEHADYVPDDDDDGKEAVHTRASRTWRVLCCFQGLVLISLGSTHMHTLVLGDPLLNKWVKLPTPEWPPDVNFLSIAAFCSSKNTVMLSNTFSACTATFDFATTEWTVDPLHYGKREVFEPVGHACCLGSVFYGAFVYYPFERRSLGIDPQRQMCCIACYDPVCDRRWRIVTEFLTGDTLFPIFLAEWTCDKMLVYMVPDREDADDFELFEASRSKAGAASSNELDVVPSPLMDDESIRGKIRLPFGLVDDRPGGGEHDPYEVFHGKGDMFFWDTFHLDKLLVLSVRHKIIKELKGLRNETAAPYSRCYYAAAPGTCELLQNLALKLEDKART